MTRALFPAGLLLLLHATTIAHALEPPGPGVEFKGAGTAAVVEQGKAFDAEAFTVALWANLKSAEGSQVFAGRGSAAQQFTLYLYHGRVRMLVEFTGGRYTHANVPAPRPGVWTHYAGTYDGRQIKLFVDGRLQAAAPADGRIPRSDTPLFLGGIDSGDRSLVGRLEDVRFLNRALADDEIPSLMASRRNPARRWWVAGRADRLRARSGGTWPKRISPHGSSR